jgi:hypothetical protein
MAAISASFIDETLSGIAAAARARAGPQQPAVMSEEDLVTFLGALAGGRLPRRRRLVCVFATSSLVRDVMGGGIVEVCCGCACLFAVRVSVAGASGGRGPRASVSSGTTAVRCARRGACWSLRALPGQRNALVYFQAHCGGRENKSVCLRMCVDPTSSPPPHTHTPSSPEADSNRRSSIGPRPQVTVTKGRQPGEQCARALSKWSYDALQGKNTCVAICPQARKGKKQKL